MIKLIKKKIEENPRRWHEVLSEALWAHRISGHGVTKVTPFELVYGQEAVLPVEGNLDAYRMAKPNDLTTVDYYGLMMDQGSLFIYLIRLDCSIHLHTMLRPSLVIRF